MKFFYACCIFILLAALFSAADSKSEAGMIPFDSPVGEIGGRGHWYSLRTMKGEDYWKDPAVTTDIKEHADGSYSIAGEAPISIALVLHPNWYPNDEPWRRAIDWVRKAEQMYRNSGVRVRFIIENIQVQEDMPDTKESAYYELPTRIPGADLIVGLMPDYSFDPLCGIAGVGRLDYYGPGMRSVSGCSPKTLAHEIGHSLGLRHDWDDRADYAERGYCIKGTSGDHSTCNLGTIMAYASDRVPLFSNNLYYYDKLPLGDEQHNAVWWLNRTVGGRALAWELSQRDGPAQMSLAPEELAMCPE